MRVPAVAAALVLGAALNGCGRSEDSNPTAAPPPADAPAAAAVDFTRPLNALGDQPFWSLKIRGEGLAFSAPAAADVKAANTGPKVSGGVAVWTAPGSDGQPLTATLSASVCQDAIAGLSYPFTAEVQAGGRTLRGCAAYADDMPRQGG